MTIQKFEITTDQWIEVRFDGTTYAIVGCTLGASEEVLESGIETESAARTNATEWAQACVEDAVESAERAAGWDPNP